MMKRYGNAIILILVLLGFLLFLTGGVWTYHSSSRNKDEIAENVDKLKAMEGEEAKDLNSRTVTKSDVDLNAEQTKILEMYDQDIDHDTENQKLIKEYDDVVVVGDSITAACLEYSWMNNDIIIARTGADVNNGADLFDSAIAKSPSVMFLCFGVNDIEKYVENVDGFIDDYTAQIENIQEKLPDTVVYVNALFPCQDGIEETSTFYNYLDEYNQRLSEMCDEYDLNYVDSGFILTEKPELYDADGVHPVSKFYPMWFTYLADVAGLSEDE